MRKLLCFVLALLLVLSLPGCWGFEIRIPNPAVTDPDPDPVPETDGGGYADEDAYETAGSPGISEIPEVPEIPIQAELLDYYRLAADMVDAYRAGDPHVVLEPAVELDLERALAYTRMLLPRHFQLREQKNLVDDILESVFYECLFPLSIDQDFDQTVSVLQGVVDESTSPGMTDREKLLVIHDWVVLQNAYPDEYDDNSRSAAALVQNGNAICSGYADAVKIMCDYAGIPCANLSGSAVNSKGEWGNHGWNAVYVEGGWLHLDATFDDPVTTTGEDILLHDYFLISTEEILENHVFDMTLSWDEMRDFADWCYLLANASIPSTMPCASFS